MKFEIKHKISGSILFEVEAESLRAALEIAIKSGANLRGADLSGANSIQINGLYWVVTITPTHVYVGCQRFGRDEFRMIDPLMMDVNETAVAQYPIVVAMLDALDAYKEATSKNKVE